MTRWRVAARLARREMRRHWVRSALVVLIIALPVLAAQAAAITFSSVHHGTVAPLIGPDQLFEPQYAGADEATGFDPRLGHPPPVAGAERIETGFVARDWTVAAEGQGVGRDDLLEVAVVGSIADASTVDPVEGRLPRTRHEAVLDGELAARTGLEVGDRFEIIASRVELEVVGITGRRNPPADRTAWVGGRAETDDDWVPEALIRLRDSGSRFVTVEMFDLYWLPTGVVAPEPILPGDEPTLADPSLEQVVGGAAGVAIAVGFVATVCSAAFAIGARRQLRSLGTLAATGAAPADLVRAVILQGTTSGLLGAGLATALALNGRALIVRGYLDDRRWDVPWSLGLVLGVAALGVLAGTAAALVPALTASRIPTLSALAGRRPERRRRLRSPYVGGVLVLAGLGLLSWASGRGTRFDASSGVAAAFGVLLVMAGAVALSPAVVAGIARLCARGRGTIRLSGRSLARDGMRSAAVVATTAVAVALPIVILVWGARESELSGVDPQRQARLVRFDEAVNRTGQVNLDGPTAALTGPVLDDVHDIVGPDGVTIRRALVTEAGSTVEATFVDTDELRAATGDDALVDALEAGAVAVALDAEDRWSDGYVRPGVLAVTDRPHHRVDLDTVSDLTFVLFGYDGDGFLLADDDLAEHDQGQDERPFDTVAVYRPTPLTAAEAERLRALSTETVDAPTVAQLRDLGPADMPTPGVSVVADVPYEGSEDADEPPIELLVLLGSVLMALAVIGTASALAAADGRGDELIVAAVGAPPGAVLRRRTLEATLTAAAATVLGGGLGAVATLTLIHHPGLSEAGVDPVLRFPIVDVLGVSIGIVAVVGVATWVALAGAGRLRGRGDLVLVDG